MVLVRFDQLTELWATLAFIFIFMFVFIFMVVALRNFIAFISSQRFTVHLSTNLRDLVIQKLQIMKCYVIKVKLQQ